MVRKKLKGYNMIISKSILEFILKLYYDYI